MILFCMRAALMLTLVYLKYFWDLSAPCSQMSWTTPLLSTVSDCVKLRNTDTNTITWAVRFLRFIQMCLQLVGRHVIKATWEILCDVDCHTGYSSWLSFERWRWRWQIFNTSQFGRRDQDYWFDDLVLSYIIVSGSPPITIVSHRATQQLHKAYEVKLVKCTT